MMKEQSFRKRLQRPNLNDIKNVSIGSKDQKSILLYLGIYYGYGNNTFTMEFSSYWNCRAFVWFIVQLHNETKRLEISIKSYKRRNE